MMAHDSYRVAKAIPNCFSVKPRPLRPNGTTAFSHRPIRPVPRPPPPSPPIPQPALAMSEKPAKTIETLLEAEEAAKRVIDSARADRDARLKAAVDEADAEIRAFKAAKESEYQAQVESYAGSAGLTSEQIAADAKNQINATLAESGKKKPDVVQLLVDHVVNVNTGAASS